MPIEPSLILFLGGIVIVLGFLVDYLFHKTGIADAIFLLIFGLLIGSYFRVIEPRMLMQMLMPLAPVFSQVALLIILMEGGMEINLYEALKGSFRAIVHPLLDAFKNKVPVSDFIDYLSAFRYPLSGEFALTSDLGLNIRVPGDWGLEIGILAEVYRNAARKRICQVDLGYYEHKHKEIGDSREKGLSKMTYDITRTLLRTLTEFDSLDISREFLLSLQVLYKRTAQNLIRQYHADALSNGLKYNRHEEETNVDIFSKMLLEAGESYINEPTGILLPDWMRAMSAMPNIRKKLRDAARLDSEPRE